MDFSKLYINGEWISGSSSDMIEVENPATGEIFASVPAGNDKDVDKAAKAAHAALPEWSSLSLEERIEMMEKFLKIFEEMREELVDITIKELGSPRSFTEKSQVDYQYTRTRSYIDLAPSVPLVEKMPLSTVYREAVGVVACITPWNYPLGQVIQKIVPALLMGNTVILKPSRNTPLSSYYLAEAFEKAGFPSGVFNLVTGRGGEVGNALSDHPLVNMVSFTGSTEGGITVGRHALNNLQHISLELGGKSPFIILPGTEEEKLSEAIHLCFNSIFLNSGQTCTAFSRLIAPRSMQNVLEEKLIEIAGEYRCGDPEKADTMLGPVASRKQFDKIRSYIVKGKEEGLKMPVGSIPEEPQSKGAYYIEPVIFTDVDNKSALAQEEIFGPVLCVIYYDDVEEAVEIANDVKYGLNAGVYGNKIEAIEVAHAIKAGNVYINASPRDTAAPFGGYKASGIGREGGVYGMLEFTQQKAMFDTGE